MLIQSKLKREGGTLIELGDIEYHFKDDGTGNHVCEVTDKSHIAKLLAIKEGFHEAGKTPAKQESTIESDDLDALPEDPNTWTNKQANDWAKEEGLNPNNKPNLLDFAEAKGIIGIDENQAPAAIIRVIAKSVLSA